MYYFFKNIGPDGNPSNPYGPPYEVAKTPTFPCEQLPELSARRPEDGHHQSIVLNPTEFATWGYLRDYFLYAPRYCPEHDSSLLRCWPTPVGSYGSQTGNLLLLHREWHPFWEPPTGEPRFVIARVNPIDDEYFAEWWHKGRLMLLWFDGTRIIEPLLPNTRNPNNGNDFRQGRDDTSTAISIWCEVQDHDQTREMVGVAEYIATMLLDMPTAPLPSFPEELVKYWPQDRTCGIHDVDLGEQSIADPSITFMDAIREERQIVVPYSLANDCLLTLYQRQAWREKAPGYLQAAGILAVSHMQGMNTKEHLFAHDMCERWGHGIPDGIHIS